MQWSGKEKWATASSSSRKEKPSPPSSSVARADPDGQQTEVLKYRPGGYFGELALLDKKSLRKATVTATSDLTLMSLDKEGFGRLLGPLEPILKRNMKKYEKFASL